MSANLPNEFNHFDSLDEEQAAIANATFAKIQANMTDAALAELVKAGIVQATADKQSAARIISGIMTAARFARGILKL